MEIDKILCRQNLNEAKNYLEGVLMLVDKPLEWTSFDVVNKIRFAIKYKYGVKKCKVGHAGTLDPLASGLLLICSGSYTKQIDRLQNESKMYSGTIQLGSVTPTYDSESEPVDFKDVPPISDTLLKKIEKQLGIILKKVDKILDNIKSLRSDFDDVRSLPRDEEERLFKLYQKFCFNFCLFFFKQKTAYEI